MATSLAFQIVALAGVYWFSETIAAALITDPVVAAECALYLRIICPALAVLATYVGMTVYLEQTARAKRAFIYNLIYLIAEIGAIELIRPGLQRSEELYTLLAIVFFCSAAFIVFEICKTQYEYRLMLKMQGATL